MGQTARWNHLPSVHAVDAKSGVGLRHLLSLDLGQSLNGGEATVLGKGQGNLLQGVGESPEGVLLDGLDIVRLLAHSESAADLGSSSSIHHPVVTNKISENNIS